MSEQARTHETMGWAVRMHLVDLDESEQDYLTGRFTKFPGVPYPEIPLTLGGYRVAVFDTRRLARQCASHLREAYQQFYGGKRNKVSVVRVRVTVAALP